ncbi:MAG TPA: PAS domain S-box protein [Thermotogota bacterium]|nr:PAS domain S-box protein [Thermotogota bacterium]
MNEKKACNYKIENCSPVPFAHKRIIFDKTGNMTDFLLIHVNPAFETLLGKRASELIGKSVFALFDFSENQYRMRLESINEKVKKSSPAVIEQYLKYTDIWLRSKWVFQGDQTVFVWFEDITNQILFENELIQNEELYKSIFDNVMDSIYIHEISAENEPERFLVVNEAACEKYGYTEEELLTVSPVEITSPDLRKSFLKNIKILLKRGDLKFISENMTRSGEKIPVEITSQLFPYKGKTVVASIARDIKERIETEKREKDNRLLLQSVLDTLPGMLLVVNTDYTIAAYNKIFAGKLAKKTKKTEDYVGKKCYQVICKRKDVCEDCYLERIMGEGTPFTEITEHVMETGSRFMKRYFAPIVNAEGNVSGIIEYTEDITELERAHKEVETASKVKTEFMMNMSHELRTPLNGILGFTGILDDIIKDEECSAYIRNIKTSGHHLLNLINDLLDFSKTGIDESEIRNEKTDLRQLLDLSLTLIHTECAKKGIQAELLIDETVPEFVFTDSTRLSRVIEHLLSNAVKFTESGQIRLKVSRIKADESHALLEFSVSDTGIGIEESDRETIFQSFTQADGSITRKYGGAGLGLALSNKLLEGFGSRIEVSSVVNRGSTFSFKVNCEYLRDEPLSEPSYYSSEERISTPIKVLIVEDNLINLQLTRVIIEKNYPGVEIFEATNGQEAVKMYLLNKPDIIFMDIRMPVMDGIEATEMIRKYSGEPVIIGLSAEVRQRNIDLGINGGMDDFMTKPVNEKELKEAIHRTLGV